MNCNHNSQCSAVAALLQDPESVINNLELSLIKGPWHVLDDERWRSFCEQSFRDIGAGLFGNTQLKNLFIVIVGDR